MTAPDLLACPFCGEKPRVHHFHGCEIACPNADCPSEPTVWQWDEAEAIAAWNTRATPAAIREAVADLADFLDAQHKSHMTGLGRNPADYMSGYSVARDMARDILALMETPHDR